PVLTWVRLDCPSPKNQSQYEYEIPFEILLMYTTLDTARAAASLKSTGSAAGSTEGDAVPVVGGVSGKVMAEVVWLVRDAYIRMESREYSTVLSKWNMQSV